MIKGVTRRIVAGALAAIASLALSAVVSGAGTQASSRHDGGLVPTPSPTAILDGVPGCC